LGSTWQPGSKGLALDPQFSNVHQYTGSGATSSTNVLTDSGANFANVVDNQDFLIATDGTCTGGCSGLLTNTKLLITSHTSTSLTVSSNLTTGGTATSVVYQTTYGHNFAIGTNLKAQGIPGAFPVGLTMGYMDIGAAQRQDAAAGSCGQRSYSCVW
jgi:hypothetical protein